jgi:transcriptional regulator with XRE-family HTH domain
VVKTLGTERHNALIALLTEKREAAGLTQTGLAAKLGEYQSFVARLESGQRRVDVIEFLELAAVLQFDAAAAIKTLSSDGRTGEGKGRTPERRSGVRS